VQGLARSSRVEGTGQSCAIREWVRVGTVHKFCDQLLRVVLVRMTIKLHNTGNRPVENSIINYAVKYTSRLGSDTWEAGAKVNTDVDFSAQYRPRQEHGHPRLEGHRQPQTRFRFDRISISEQGDGLFQARLSYRALGAEQ